MSAELEVAEFVELASERPFRVGTLLIEPARLRVSRDSESRQLERRVMQVLVVLGRAEGRVVSRAELVERCWDGRIVGENAIQRVISRLRQLSMTLGGFDLETVTKVGYVIRPSASPQSHPASASLPRHTDHPTARQSPTPVLSRRLLVGATVAVGIAGIAASGVVNASNPAAAESRKLLSKAREAQLAGLPEQTEQAIAYLKRSVELDPEHVEAWGALAIAYQQMLNFADANELGAYAGWTRSAASRALAIDPANVEAQVALATVLSPYRRWGQNENEVRAIVTARGSHQASESALGWILCDTGRWRDAIACFRRALAFEPYHPGNQLILARGLWGHGQLAEADQILEQSAKLWPGHRGVWEIRLGFLATTGQAGAALAMLEDPAARPLIAPGDQPPPLDALVAFVKAKMTGSTSDLALANAAVGTPDAPGPLGSHPMFLMALDRFDETFAYAEAFFFGNARRPPPGPLSRRKTAFLFYDSAEPLRRDKRFGPLVERLGLAAYWRQTGSRSDFPF